MEESEILFKSIQKDEELISRAKRQQALDIAKARAPLRRSIGTDETGVDDVELQNISALSTVATGAMSPKNARIISLSLNGTPNKRPLQKGMKKSGSTEMLIVSGPSSLIKGTPSESSLSSLEEKLVEEGTDSGNEENFI